MEGRPLASWLASVLGGGQFRTRSLTGGASDRWYSRVSGADVERFTGHPSAVAMGVPPRLRYVLQHFASVRSFLEAHGQPVPACYVPPGDDAISLLEDLGDTPLTEVLLEPAKRGDACNRAVELLLDLHTVPTDPHRCAAMKLHFDRGKYDFEFRFHFWRWVIGAYLAVDPTPGEREELDRAFSWVAGTLADAPRVFTHRDFQSSNLMVREGGSLSLIDFQDARQGTRAYDLASFIYDSYVTFTDTERARMENAYWHGLASHKRPDADQFSRLVVAAALQRKLHDAGAFVYTAHARGKTDYLRWVPDTLDMVIELAAKLPETVRVGEILGHLRQSAERQA